MAKLEQGVNDLATTHPELSAQWHPTANGDLTPDQVTAGSARPIVWQYHYTVPQDHSVEHLRGKEFTFEWVSRIQNRANGTLLPPFLTGHAVWPGFNDLATTHPDLAAQWHPTANGDLTPEMVTANSSKKVVWQATYWDKDLQQECTHQWPARIQNRANGTDCPQKMASKGEKFVRAALENKGVSFIEQNVFPDRVGLYDNSLLRDDFAIFDKNDKVVATIEFHGIQHYEPVSFGGRGQKDAEKNLLKNQEYDKIKADYLAAHGIKQLVVPYTELDNVDKIVKDFVQELSKEYALYPDASKPILPEVPISKNSAKVQGFVSPSQKAKEEHVKDFMNKIMNQGSRKAPQKKSVKNLNISTRNDIGISL